MWVTMIQKLTTRVLRQSVPAGARGSRAAAKSHTFIFLQRKTKLFYTNLFIDIKQVAKTSLMTLIYWNIDFFIPASILHPGLCLCILQRTEKRMDFEQSTIQTQECPIPLDCSVAAYNKTHFCLSRYVQMLQFLKAKHIHACRWLSNKQLEKYYRVCFPVCVHMNEHLSQPLKDFDHYIMIDWEECIIHFELNETLHLLTRI